MLAILIRTLAILTAFNTLGWQMEVLGVMVMEVHISPTKEKKRLPSDQAEQIFRPIMPIYKIRIAEDMALKLDLKTWPSFGL